MENNKIKVSVIVPVYNTEEYLDECFESLFNQSLKNFEVVAIDDGSTDGSLNKLKQIQKKYPSLIIKSQKNAGLGATRNVGAKETTGEYIYFMDSDDIIEPYMLEKSVELLERSGSDFVGFQADIFGDIEGRNINEYKYVDRYLEDLKVYGGIEFQKKYHLVIPLYNIPFCVYRRGFLEDNNMVFMEGVLHEDVEFYWHLMTCNPRFIVSKDIVYHRRYRQSSIMTGDNSAYRFKSRLQVFMKLSDEAVAELRDIYLYYAIRGLNNALKDAYNCHVQLEVEDYAFIDCFLHRKLENVSELSVLHELLFLDYISKLEKVGYQFNRTCVLISDFKKKILSDAFLSKLYTSGNKIAIYGTGDYSQIVIDRLKAVVGDFIAEIVYLDTYAITGKKKFQGDEVFNYQDVNRCTINL